MLQAVPSTVEARAGHARVGVKVLINGILQPEAMQNLIRNLGQKVTEKALDVLNVGSQKVETKLKKATEKLSEKLQKLLK